MERHSTIGAAEWAVDCGAALAFAAAVAFAVSTGFGLSAAAAAAVLGFSTALTALRWLPPTDTVLHLPSFTLGEIVTQSDDSLDELLLTDRLLPSSGQESVRARTIADELLLDDILAELEPGARVVRLFEPRQPPTAGELQASIDRHLGRPNSSAPPDASQALSDALAELRRALR